MKNNSSQFERTIFFSIAVRLTCLNPPPPPESLEKDAQNNDINAARAAEALLQTKNLKCEEILLLKDLEKILKKIVHHFFF